MSRILYACSTERDYIRHRVLVRALRRGHRVRVIGSRSPRYPARLGSVIPRVLGAGGRFDVHVAGFLGQPLVPFMRARGMRPLVLDAFVSLYDTLCLDRRQFSPRSPAGRFLHAFEQQALRAADHVLTDTPASSRFMAGEFGVDESRFTAVPVGADESLFYPREASSDSGRTVSVLYFSTYLPLHGTDVVLEMARALKDRGDIRFVLIGRGPERARADAFARTHALDNCEFIDWVPLAELPERIAACDIFLGGHFSAENEKARRVVPGKVYQGIAMARPVILGDAEANREWFSHGENACLVPMGDPQALAEAVSALAAHAGVRERIATGGRQLFEERFSEEAISGVLEECVGKLMDRSH